MKNNIYKKTVFLILLLPMFVFLATTQSQANEITIPWTVDLYIPSHTVVPPFVANYTAVDFAPPFGPDRMGLDFVSTHEQSYTVHLPFEINISTPDHVSPGQLVALDSSAVLAGTPSFTTQGSVSFDTQMFADNDSFPLGTFGNEISYSGVSLTVAGTSSYTDTDITADERLARTIWRNDPYGNPLQLNRAERFKGYELQTTSNEDGWGGSIDLLQFASNFIEPPVGTAAAVVSAIIDLQVGPQFDIMENTYLTTQFVSGFYTDDGGSTYDDFLINGADRKGWLTIPDTLSPGDTYKIQMTALGLGFNTLLDYLLQGNIDIDLEVLSGLYNVDIAEIPIGSEFLVDSWVDRFQYVQFMNPLYGGFLSAEEFANAFLSFDIVGGLADQDPAKIAPNWEIARVDPFIGTLIETGADQGQQSYDFPGNPPSATATVTSIPEPSTLLLLGSGLVGLAGLRRKFKFKS